MCPKCGGGSFQLEPITVMGGEDIILAVCCYTCHTTIGTLADPAAIDKKLGIINQNLGQIINGMKQLSNQLIEVRKSNES